MNENKTRVLVVDDEPEIVKTLNEYLSLKGYDVAGAYSGEEALDALEKDRRDIVLLDIKMPGIQGTEVARIIKDRYPLTRVIIVTAFPLQSNRLSRDQVIDDMFTKPCKLDSLYNKLSELFHTPNPSEIGKDEIEARVLQVRAKLLFVEQDPKTYEALSNHFKRLSSLGEHYEAEVACGSQEILEKLATFNPDFFVVNTVFAKEQVLDLLLKAADNQSCPTGIIGYTAKSCKELQLQEVERLTKAVEHACLKNGLIDIKWVKL